MRAPPTAGYTCLFISSGPDIFWVVNIWTSAGLYRHSVRHNHSCHFWRSDWRRPGRLESRGGVRYCHRQMDAASLHDRGWRGKLARASLWRQKLYGAKTLPTDSYRARTFRNAQESDGTIWFDTT